MPSLFFEKARISAHTLDRPFCVLAHSKMLSMQANSKAASKIETIAAATNLLAPMSNDGGAGLISRLKAAGPFLGNARKLECGETCQAPRQLLFCVLAPH